VLNAVIVSLRVYFSYVRTSTQLVWRKIKMDTRDLIFQK